MVAPIKKDGGVDDEALRRSAPPIGGWTWELARPWASVSMSHGGALVLCSPSIQPLTWEPRISIAAAPSSENAARVEVHGVDGGVRTLDVAFDGREDNSQSIDLRDRANSLWARVVIAARSLTVFDPDSNPRMVVTRALAPWDATAVPIFAGEHPILLAQLLDHLGQPVPARPYYLA